MCIWNVSKEDRQCKYCKVTQCDDRIVAGRRNGTVMPTLINSQINSISKFIDDKYNAVRTAIYYLRKDYEMDFSYYRKDGFIIVRRIK